MANQTLDLKEPLLEYIQKVGVRESDILKQLRRETNEKTERLSVMQISPEQGQLMAFLVALTGARRILEVGTFTGYSALVCAMALPQDSGTVVTCDISTEWTDIARPFWDKAGIAHKIDLRIAPAIQTLESFLIEDSFEPFDMMFIDADKTGYDDYYELGLRLLRPGGLMLIDNVLWGGAVADETRQDEDTLAIRKLNQKIHQDPRVSLALIPIGDGLTLVRRGQQAGFN